MLFPATVRVQSSSVRAAYSTTAMSHKKAYDSRFACRVQQQQQKIPKHIRLNIRFLSNTLKLAVKSFVKILFLSIIYSKDKYCTNLLYYDPSLYSVSRACMWNHRVMVFICQFRNKLQQSASMLVLQHVHGTS